MEAEFFQWAQLLVSGVGLGAIFLGLVRMKESGRRRDREIDEMARAFTQQGEAMTQAFTQQGAALAEIGRGLREQGEVLAELLRRSA